MTQYEKLVVSAYTGILMTEMPDFQNFVEKTLGRPVQTFEFADELIWETLKEKLKPDFMELCKEDTPQIQQEADEPEKVSSVDNLISQATAISKQSAELADDLSKFKDGFDMTD